MKRYIVLIGILCLSGVVTLKAQQERNQGIIWSSLRGLEYTVRAGINIGGTAPVPLPREIRAIDSYRPTLCVSIEGDIKKWFGESKEWGMMIGFRLENKGMETKATVKNYSMEIIGSGGEKLKGNWTGGGELLFLDPGRGSLPIKYQGEFLGGTLCLVRYKPELLRLRVRRLSA